MAVDIFSPRVMLEGVRTMHPADRYFLDTYCQGTRRFTSLSVDVDIYKQLRRIAPFANPRAAGQVMNGTGYKTINFKPPYIKPKMVTTAEQLLNERPFGVDVYDEYDPMVEGAKKLGEDFSELDDMITRREEWMFLQGLQFGEITVTGDGVARTIAFDFDSTHLVSLTGTDCWNDPDSDPMADLARWRLRVLQDYGRAPVECVLGQNAASLFLNHAKVQAYFNKWNFIPGQIVIDANENMIDYGYIKALGMRLMSVSEFFLDPDDNTVKEMYDADHVTLLCRGFRARKYYGAIQLVDNLVSAPRFPKSWIDEDPSCRWAQLHSAPLPCIEEPDAVLTAKVVE